MAASVLVVDDDIGMVETLADILAARTYRVATASSGAAAIRLARTTRYDAVLMDIRMPDLDGVQALRAIRAWAPGTPVILMTAFTRHELVEDGRRARAEAILPKPLEMERVLSLLDQLTGRPAGPGEAER